MTNHPYARAGAPSPRASLGHASQFDGAGHIQGVNATPGGLLRTTVGSMLAALAILTLFWLPAEYGVDPTGLGRAMGLTQMGEIKQQLYVEAAKEDAILAAQTAAAQVSADPALLARLEAIEAQVASISATIGAIQQPVPTPVDVAPEPEATVAEPEQQAVAPTPPPAPEWRDEVSYTLAPTEGIEVKLAMTEGARAEFEWTANGSVLNYDTHGDGGGNSITYEQGRGEPGQTGELVAAFDGNHGWFWRNRTEAPVTFTLRARGDYERMIAP
ncbi:MAG: hypothetical protein AAFW76_06795 [Pseudomonadota bacterium]